MNNQAFVVRGRCQVNETSTMEVAVAVIAESSEAAEIMARQHVIDLYRQKGFTDKVYIVSRGSNPQVLLTTYEID